MSFIGDETMAKPGSTFRWNIVDMFGLFLHSYGQYIMANFLQRKTESPVPPFGGTDTPTSRCTVYGQSTMANFYISRRLNIDGWGGA